MNRIYLSVWNAALGAWMAVSEHGRRRGKGSAGSTSSAGAGRLFLAGLALAAFASGSAVAGGAGGGGGGGRGGRGGDGIGGGGGGGGRGGASVATGSGAANGQAGGLSGQTGIGGIGGTAGIGLGAGAGGGGGGANSGAGGAGGAGGNAGYAPTVSGPLSLGASHTGGGGSAGEDGSGLADGGGGGGGGDGVAVSASATNILVLATLTGGTGGTGGGGPYGVGGGGGGGSGMLLMGAGNLLLVEAGASVMGGQGGVGGLGPFGVGGLGGGGAGVFISGDGNTIVNAGHVGGGLSGNGQAQANAVVINGSNNTVSLEAGYSFTGNVVVSGSANNTLDLGGATSASFNTSAIGAQYQGFSNYTKTGASTWTLTGSTTAVTPWILKAGTLIAAASGALGSGMASVGAAARLEIDEGTTQTNLVQLTGNGASFVNRGTLDTTAQMGRSAVEGLAGFTGQTVENSGAIVANADTSAVWLRGAGASVTNHLGATVETTHTSGMAVRLDNGGTVVNDGTLRGHYRGVDMRNFSNGSSDGHLINTGLITADGVGSAGVAMNMGSDYTLDNRAGGVIEGVSTGVRLVSRGSAQVDNAGTIRTTGTEATGAAVQVAGGDGNAVRNLAGGVIESVAGVGVQIESGAVRNAHGATIAAPIAIQANAYDPTYTVDITNHGTIRGDIDLGLVNGTVRLGADGVFSGVLRTDPLSAGVVQRVVLIGSESGAAAAGTLDGAQLSGFEQLEINAPLSAWTLTGAFARSGATALKAGRLNLGHNQALGTGALEMDDGTTLGFSVDGLTIANAIRLTGSNDPVIDTGSFSETLSGGISGGGFLTKQGSGTLTLAAANNSYTGATDVARGTLKAGAAGAFSADSLHTVASGATLDTGGFNQSVPGLVNNGTVSLLGGAAGSTLTVTGPYTGNGGVLRLGTALGTGVADRLLLSGATAVASGNTTVQVTNLDGLGAPTTGKGIELIGTAAGGRIEAGAFALAGGHVDAGAYEYRLNTTASGGYLSSYGGPVVPVDPVAPVDPAVPATPATPPAPAPAAAGLPLYRAEVPLFAALPEQLRQGNLAMLGNLHQRMGDDDLKSGGTPNADTGERRAWGRVLSTNLDIRQGGTVSPTSHGRLTGFQAGTDLFANTNWRAGVYVGRLDGDMQVSGFARGIANLSVGSNSLRSDYLGAYGSYTGDSGFYADAVLQGGRHRYDVSPLGAYASSHGKASSLLASLEVGQAFALGGSGNWKVEPQLQLVHQRVNLDDVTLVGATVRQDAHNGWLLRAGARVKGEIATGVGLLQPYARVNVYRRSSGTDIANFVGPAASTAIATRTGGTSTELAAGATLALSERTSVYGEIGKLWASGGDAKVGSSVQGSLGVRVKW